MARLVEKTVFISYRRSNPYHARAVYQYLTAHGFDVFLDFDSVDSGAFNQIILNQIKARAHFLIVMTPSALERCISPDDWLRREIETALETRRNVVPLLFDEFKFSDAKSYLTGKLIQLANYNGLEVPPSYFDEAMERLCKRFLNTTLKTVLHPIPEKDKSEVARKLQNAAAASAPKQEQLDAERHYEMAFTLYSQGDFYDCVEDFTRTIELNPNFIDAYYYRGHAYRRQLREKEAIKDWQTAKQLIGQDDPKVHLFNCEIFRLRKDYKRALKEASTYIRCHPNNPKAYKVRGDIYSDAGDYDKAIDDFNEALRLNPEYDFAYGNRGYARGLAGDYEEAIIDFNEALRLNPKDVTNIVNRAWARNGKGDYDGAIAECNKALRFNRKYPWAYYQRGFALGQKGDHDGAIADYDKALKINSKFADAYNHRGFSRSQKGDHNGAIADYDEALKINPKFEWAYNNRGFSRSQKGDHDEAIADYDKALKINPKFEWAYYNRGFSRSKKFDHDGAIADYSKVIQLNPKNDMAYYNRGVAYKRKFRNDNAIADYRTALKINPNNKLAKAALRIPDFKLKIPGTKVYPWLKR